MALPNSVATPPTASPTGNVMSDTTHTPHPLPPHLPVVGICGYSGSGKTTLIEAILPRLTARGLQVAVIKQDAHELAIDHPGKDSDRLFNAGADVLIRDANQAFHRRHRRDAHPPLEAVIRRLAPAYDLILVEGHKTAPLAWKVWLCRPDENGPPPPAAVNIRRSLDWHADREAGVLKLIEACLAAATAATPVHAGILIGGGSTRMGRPKHLIGPAGLTWLERTVAVMQPHVDALVLLGAGDVPASLADLPRLPDVADTDAGGPIRGMRAALRWAPLAGWIFAACDQPRLGGAAIAWLLAQRAPGIQAVMPRRTGADAPEPFPAWYDFRAGRAIESLRRPRDLAAMPRSATPVIPAELAEAWLNINTPSALRAHLADGRVDKEVQHVPTHH